MQKEKKKFYQSGWFLWLCLIVVPPVGLIILWACHEKMNKILKTILSIIFGLWAIMFVVGIFSTGTDNEKANIEEEINQSENEQKADDKETQENAENKNQEGDTDTAVGSLLTDVEDAIQVAVGEDETITDVLYKDRDLCVCVDLSQADPAPLTYELLMESRTSSITEKVLEFTEYDDLWDTVTIDFGELGYIRNGKDNISGSGYGRYFDPINFEIVTDGTQQDSSKHDSDIAGEGEKSTENELPTDARIYCDAITKTFVKEVVGEKFSSFDFSISDFDLDENEDGTIDVLYLPSNAGNGATKVNLTISKKGESYEIQYALLAGLYEVNLDELPEKYVKYDWLN